jgi:hypothetical protein
MPIDSHLPQADPFSLVPTFKEAGISSTFCACRNFAIFGKPKWSKVHVQSHQSYVILGKPKIEQFPVVAETNRVRSAHAQSYVVLSFLL